MRLNQECVRDLLLVIEDIEIDHYIAIDNLQLGNYTKNELCYTADKLLEAGYINGRISAADGHRYYHFPVESLTWVGHQFLDNIRDDGVWKDTKKIVSKLSSVSLNLLENISTQVLTNLISRSMGL